MKQVKKIKKVIKEVDESVAGTVVKNTTSVAGILAFLAKIGWKKAFDYFMGLVKGKKLNTHTILHGVWATAVFMMFNANVEQTQLNTVLEQKVDSTQQVVTTVVAKADSTLAKADSIVELQGTMIWKDSKGNIHIGK